MPQRTAFALILALAASAIPAHATAATQVSTQDADTGAATPSSDAVAILTAARIHTGDLRQPQATAIAWDAQGRVVAIGTAAELRKRWPAARRIDAGKATVVPGLIEQDMGAWQGRPHAEIPALLRQPAHAFWPLAGDEAPPAGESMAQVITRVGAALEELAPAHAGRDLVVVSHGGAIRAAVAHALGIGATAALHLSVQNLSLTCIERHARGWKVVCVNEMAGF